MTSDDRSGGHIDSVLTLPRHGPARRRVLHRLLAQLPLTACVISLALGIAIAQDRGPQAVSSEALKEAIDALGSLDFPVRMKAARTVRRTPAAQAVPALLQAAAEHRDGYVRFRALVLLAGFNDPRAKDAMSRAAGDPNDRLREVAFAYFEHHPDPAQIPLLLTSLQKEEGEFVRPRLIRALAAHATDAKVRETLLREVGHGQDFFRSAVIEALGDNKAAYAVGALIEIANQDGPLRTDAAVALGKIGDRRALELLARLQRAASKDVQPQIAAAICLLGVNCGSHVGYLAEMLRFAEKNIGFQTLLRSASAGLAALGAAGNQEAIGLLIEVGVPSQDPARAPIALALGTVALRNTAAIMAALEAIEDRDARARAMGLLRDGFDMLEEDFEEERFFVTVRRTYWASSDGSPTRTVAEGLIQKLEF
jgi:HEAT repeat protein